jgi:hypothetical protein
MYTPNHTELLDARCLHLEEARLKLVLQKATMLRSGVPTIFYFFCVRVLVETLWQNTFLQKSEVDSVQMIPKTESEKFRAINMSIYFGANLQPLQN